MLGATNNRKGATDAIISGNYKLMKGYVICDGWTDQDYPSSHHRRADALDCDPGKGKVRRCLALRSTHSPREAPARDLHHNAPLQETSNPNMAAGRRAALAL